MTITILVSTPRPTLVALATERKVQQLPPQVATAPQGPIPKIQTTQIEALQAASRETAQQVATLRIQIKPRQ